MSTDRPGAPRARAARVARSACLTLCLASAAAAVARAAVDEALTLQAGRLVVAVYKDNAPFSDEEKGIDVDVGKALAAKVGLTPEVREYPAADDVDGDLRNIIWRGHHLWRGKLADVMMHVPVDRYVIEKNDKVKIFAPYFHERVVLARNRARIPNLPTLQIFTSEKIGVQVETLEDRYLMTSFGGLLRENVVHFGSIEQAAGALLEGKVAAIMGRESIIQATLAKDAARFEIAPAPAPGLALTGWDLGLAVKAENPELAAALERAMHDLISDGTVERIFAQRAVTYRPPSSFK
jgi:polar amino acid transport system substrate-binding protein